MQVSKLEGQTLDRWVLHATGLPLDAKIRGFPKPYSTDWALAGPIIEREQMTLGYDDQGGRERGYWLANHEFPSDKPLVAAMRAFVASRFGDEVNDEPA